MPKRGQTQPFRMTFTWPAFGTEKAVTGNRPFYSLAEALDAAARQVETIGGTSGRTDCLVDVTNRNDPNADPVSFRACDNCGKATKWDTEHAPAAWRHVANGSRWCDQADDETTPSFPTSPPAPPAARITKPLTLHPAAITRRLRDANVDNLESTAASGGQAVHVYPTSRVLGARESAARRAAEVLKAAGYTVTARGSQLTVTRP